MFVVSTLVTLEETLFITGVCSCSETAFLETSSQLSSDYENLFCSGEVEQFKQPSYLAAAAFFVKCSALQGDWVSVVPLMVGMSRQGKRREYPALE